MKLQRWNVGRGGLDTADAFDDKGEWVRWADVLAWRDSIRAAVDAERASMRETNGRVLPGAALDALLTDGGV